LWGTSNGIYNTDKVGDIEISFVEYSASKKICLQLDIVEGHPPMYDLIIVKQILHNLKVVLNFKEKTIQKGKIFLPMRNIANLQLKPSINRVLMHNTYLAQEPVSISSATKWVVEILDAKYEKADIPTIVREIFSYLDASDGEKLLSMLLKFELLFDGALGDWNLLPASIEIKEGMKPYHDRPYPIPHKHKAVLIKETEWLCNIVLFGWQPLTQWVLPNINVPKKDGTVHTISDFRELKKHIVRKPYPILKNSTTLHELEGFTFVTAHDLNMCYYTIRLDPAASSKICTIIFPWRKYSYKRLSMGLGVLDAQPMYYNCK
jgi:hypothetical protein